ncbi:hypothetical protein LCGC14_0575720 [marine sediment metagenome]|uniref:Uncharacterized protein n=1 Tax=marine sediment metagenome TaxID=412755 RepID=A0A0F9RMW3_9ZZZZ
MSRASIAGVFAVQGERIKPQDQSDFVRAVNLLNKVINRVAEYEPEAGYYMSVADLNLMVGPSHIGSGGSPLYDNVALSWTIDNADCGDW